MLEWDKSGKRYYETGVSKGVLYQVNEQGQYTPGVAWNGLTSVNESPDGADPNELWADNMKYGVLYSAETLGLTIEAYTYPDEFAECDGSAQPVPGLRVGQQTRKAFGLCYRTEIGNDQTNEAGYLLHLIYGCHAQPSDRDYETINDSPDAMTFSWEIDTTPVAVTGTNYKPTASIIIDSRTVDADKLTSLENMLYGVGQDATAHMPLPADVIAHFEGNG